ncbi:hypothetical protein ACSBR1_000773 [Camellia fascicularis]
MKIASIARTIPTYQYKKGHVRINEAFSSDQNPKSLLFSCLQWVEGNLLWEGS